MKKVLITGATGFVGKALCERLIRDKYQVVAAIRKSSNLNALSIEICNISVDDISVNTDWKVGLKDVKSVVHLAARVHVMNDTVSDPLYEFRKTNFEGTMQLAKGCVKAGVKRFVYLSTIKVHGEESFHGQPFTENDTTTQIKDPYGISKQETESALLDLSKKSGMEVVIIRPPLVYGPGVKANFFNMMKWLYRGVPLPFGSIKNKRSLIGLDNLVDLIVTCMEHPSAANQIFLASDGEDLSTTELLKRVSAAMNKSSRLLPVPQKLIEFSLKFIGKDDLSRRLCGSLQVDISKARKLLNWSPSTSVDHGIEMTVQHFLEKYLR